MSEAEELRAFFSDPAFARPLDRIRSTLERLDAESLGSITVVDLDERELDALGRILGRRPAGRRLALGRLDTALRATRFEMGLREAVGVVDGAPLRSRPAERRTQESERAGYLESVRAHPLVIAQPALIGWIYDLVRLGLLRRLADGPAGEAALLSDSMRVLEGLGSPRSLDRLAAATLGSAHALDPGRPVTAVVLRALAGLSDVPVPASAEERRALWAAHGVAVDALSSRVLVSGLRPTGPGVPRSLRTLAEAGEPVALPLRTLSRYRLRISDRVAFVCENPDVMELALDAGAVGCLLICTEGVPSVAAIALLRSLRSDAVAVRVHADFDWGGVAIARRVLEESAGTPWRFAAADYDEALARAGDLVQPLDPERRRPTPWDAGLSDQMVERGRSVEEEVVADLLVDDLVIAASRDRRGGVARSTPQGSLSSRRPRVEPT